jgi:hypothetical protein
MPLRLTAKVTAICENQPPSAVRSDYSVFGTKKNIDLIINKLQVHNQGKSPGFYVYLLPIFFPKKEEVIS